MKVRRETLHGGGWGIPSGRRLGVGAGARLGGVESRGAYPQKPAVCLGRQSHPASSARYTDLAGVGSRVSQGRLTLFVNEGGRRASIRHSGVSLCTRRILPREM